MEYHIDETILAIKNDAGLTSQEKKARMLEHFAQTMPDTFALPPGGASLFPGEQPFLGVTIPSLGALRPASSPSKPETTVEIPDWLS